MSQTSIKQVPDPELLIINHTSRSLAFQFPEQYAIRPVAKNEDWDDEQIQRAALAIVFVDDKEQLLTIADLRHRRADLAIIAACENERFKEFFIQHRSAYMPLTGDNHQFWSAQEQAYTLAL